MSSIPFGTWLQQQRMALGLQQKELEERAELSQSYISKVEKGRVKLPDETTRGRIHAVLGTTEDDLVAVGILVRFEPRPGSVIYQPADRVGTANVRVPTPPSYPETAEAATGIAEDVPPHMRASFAKVSELSPERQDQLKSLIDTFYEADQAYRAQIRRDTQRRREEGIEE